VAPGLRAGARRPLRPAGIAHQQANERQVRLNLEAVSAVALALEGAHAGMQPVRQRHAEQQHLAQLPRDSSVMAPTCSASHSSRRNCTKGNWRAPNVRAQISRSPLGSKRTRSGGSLPSGGSENSVATARATQDRPRSTSARPLQTDVSIMSCSSRTRAAARRSGRREACDTGRGPFACTRSSRCCRIASD